MIINLPSLVVDTIEEKFLLRIVVCRNDCLRLEIKDKYNRCRSAPLYAGQDITINKIVYLINLYNITKDKGYLEELTNIFEGKE